MTVVCSQWSVVGKAFFPLALSAVLFALSSSAYAQQAKKVYRIGYLSSGSVFETRERVIRQGLRELGYIEGQNTIIEWRFAKGNAERLPELAAELVRLKPDVILTSGTEPTRAVKNATTTIPIVVTGAGDLVGRGLVTSLARPGGNITGLTNIAPELNGKRLELLKEVLPHLSRVGFLYQPYEQDELREIQFAARALGVQIQPLDVKTASQLQVAYAAMTKQHVDALTISRNPLTNFHRREIIDVTVKHQLPAMCDGTDWIDDGCLMSYSPDRNEGFRRAALYVDRILKGAKPGELPVEQPKKFEFIINLKAAKQIGLTIPPQVLARADKVIK